jgi:hypothetical protein
LLECEAKGFRYFGLALAGLKPSGAHASADMLVDGGGVSGHLLVLRGFVSTIYREPRGEQIDQSAAHLLTRDSRRRMAANIAKPPLLLRDPSSLI